MSNKVTIVDYGVGNLFSLCSSFEYIGAEVEITSDAEKIRNAERIILPGVGAFADAREKLRASGLDLLLCEEAKKGKLIMGICLGMQMLFDKSFEYGEHEGLGLIKGEVVGMEGRLGNDLKIPHIGWNALKIKSEHPLFKYVKEGDCVYFVHSYYAENCSDALLAVTEYGKELTAAVASGNVMGCQFHPEKSGDVGLKILKAFTEM